MRTEQEMYELIIKTAEEDDRIRAVYMNGSRTNSNVPKDIFQDYDIVYVVTETRPYYEDTTWIDRFGERLYMQMPERMDALRGQECRWKEEYGWLIQFADGVRLDLHVQSVSFAEQEITKDRLCRILLDKDHILPEMPPSTDEDYHVTPPTEDAFQCCCNEFWWCLNNVAKGLWRGEVPYVMDMLNGCIRPELIRLLSWKIGAGQKYTVSIGKSGKYMYRYLDEAVWERFLATYPDASVEHIWESVFIMCGLFSQTAVWVAEKNGYTYNKEEGDASRGFLEHVRNLPKDAEEVYQDIALETGKEGIQ